MITKKKRTAMDETKTVTVDSVRFGLSKSQLPEPYRHLLSLILSSSDHLIHKASSHDKISS
jgi:hypothetical protein